MKNQKMQIVLAVCIIIFIACGIICFLKIDAFGARPLQRTTSFSAPAMAKYERDGNLYVIDSGSFRLVCMSPDRKIKYTINIDRFNEYIRFVDGAIDEAGNLYVYAIEAERDALLTKRDIIRKYDAQGRFVKDIIIINYDDPYTNPRLFCQFGSFRCENGVLTFSKTGKDNVILYQYDTLRDELLTSEFFGGAGDFLVAQLILKDMKNFAYVRRDGNIYEVINGAAPVLRASFDWNLKEGGIYPWYIFYDHDNNLIFFDLGSNALFRISKNLYGSVVHDETGLQRIVPKEHFDPFIEDGKNPSLAGFGFYGNIFAGVYDDVVWLYDGLNSTVYNNKLLLPLGDRFSIAFVQIALVLGILAFIAGLYVLFIKILNRYISLFIKQTVLIIPLLAIAFFIVFSVTYNIMNKRYIGSLMNEMIGMATLSSKVISGDDIDKINSIKDIHSDEYKRLARIVKELVGYNADPWNQAYYAAIYKGRGFKHIVVISEEEWNVFRPDAELDDDDYSKIMRGEPIVVTSELFNGTWTFANMPIYNSKGEVSGKFEVGLDMTSFETSNTKLKRQVALITATVCIIILLALGFIVSVVVKQLASVVNVLRAIASGNLNERVRYSAQDELGKVGQGLNMMAEELQSQFDRINRLNESTIRFVPVQFMEHLGVSDITSMKLGDNVQREISVLFFDIRSFSINSEMMTAKENFEFINAVLGTAGPIIRKHNGFVDKYIGDAAMVLFVNGLDAVRAGIELYHKLVVDESTMIKIGADGINIGVGIHTGSVMMGIVGENERLSSTVISANVNLASRVEGLTKQTGAGLLITRDTLNQLSGNENEFAYRFIGMVQAAGVNEVVGLFDILDALPAVTREVRLATKEAFESGVRKFHMKDYAGAVQRFEEVLNNDPTDVLTSFYLKEAHLHIQKPGLSSVFVFDRK